MNEENRLYKRRKELGLTLEQVGEKCGVGKSTVRKWETEQISNMGRDNIISLAKTLQVSPLFILNTEYENNDKSLSQHETRLLQDYNKLNTIGRKEAISRVEELTYIPKYTLEPGNGSSDEELEKYSPYLNKLAARSGKAISRKDKLLLIKELIELETKKQKEG